MINAVNIGFFNMLKTYPTTWTQNTAKSVGDIVKPTSYNSRTYVCTVAGTTHANTEPTWSTTIGATQTDGSVTWKVFDMKTYNVKSPQSATVPYVTFGLETNRPIGTFESLTILEDLTYWVNIFSSTSVAHITTLTDLVLAVMDDASLTVSGYTAMKCIREFMSNITWEMETGIYQISLRYRVWVDNT